MIILTEFGGRTAFLALEHTVEVAEIVISAEITDVGNTLCCIDKHPCGIAKSDVDDIITDGTTGVHLEEAAERSVAHAGKLREGVELQLVHIMTVDIVLHLEYAVGVFLYLHLGIACGGKSV